MNSAKGDFSFRSASRRKPPHGRSDHLPLLAWEDNRSLSNSGVDIYAQHLDNSGRRQWGNAAAKICSVRNDQFNQRILSDGNGGAFIAWEDRRTQGNADLYIQWINAMGIPQWTDSGRAVCRANGIQQSVRMAPDGVGGLGGVVCHEFRGNEISKYRTDKHIRCSIPILADSRDTNERRSRGTCD